jgi:diadenylate cyclase
VEDFINEILFFLQRVDLLTFVDLLLVTVIFTFILSLVRGTQAVVILRGMILLLIVVFLLTSLVDLPAFSWLLRTTLPALVVAIPVIFAPEIRRALERLGRAGSMFSMAGEPTEIERTVRAIVIACQYLSDRRFGGLIVIERESPLDEYVETGARMDALLSADLLQQIFYPNTPLHDGAVIVHDGEIVAAACVMPLSASGTTSRSLERQMGLRHRAALGISEVSDAVAVVVSEETGAISVTHSGRMIRRLDQSRLRNILMAFHRPQVTGRWPAWLNRFISRLGNAMPLNRKSG